MSRLRWTATLDAYFEGVGAGGAETGEGSCSRRIKGVPTVWAEKPVLIGFHPVQPVAVPEVCMFVGVFGFTNQRIGLARCRPRIRAGLDQS